MPTTEERLAALETKLAALTTTTPTTYYTHQYSGEEIDNAVGRALTGGALDTSVTNVSNQLGTFVKPNLLDNWYFGRPVNQMGQTEYTGGYSIDRWQLLDKNKLVITDNAVELTYIDNNYVVWEKLESIPKGTYSLSLLFADGAFVTWSGVVDISQAGFEVGTVRHKNWNIVIHNDKTVRITCIGSIGDKVAILAAKLELGPTQTLAHREGDKWVLNEIPDYGGQLRRCQRYCQIDDCTTSYTVVANGIAASATYWRGLLPMHIDMRAKPTISLIGDNISAQLIGNNQSISVSGLSLTVVDSSPAGTAISLSGVVGLIQNQNYALQLYRCKIIRSADL